MTETGALRTSQECGEIYGALAVAAAHLGPVIKDKTAKVQSSKASYSYNYADLASALDACREPLAKAGVCVLQGWDMEGDRVRVTTRLGHSSGQWVECTAMGWPTRDDIQGVGSAITYLRRYSLLAMVGLAPDDDDGQAAVQQGKPRQQKRQAPPMPSEPYPDQRMREACGKAMGSGWTEDQVAECLMYFGAPDAKVASLPPSSAGPNRPDCWRALQGRPPQPVPQASGQPDDADEPPEHPLDRLRLAAQAATAEGRWTVEEVAVLLTLGVARMTRGTEPKTIEAVPVHVAGAMVGTLSLPFRDWAKAVNSTTLNDALEAMTAERALRFLEDAPKPQARQNPRDRDGDKGFTNHVHDMED